MKKAIIAILFFTTPVAAVIGWCLMYGDYPFLGIRIMSYGVPPGAIVVLLNNPQVFKRRR